jgi:hypothetical protein
MSVQLEMWWTNLRVILLAVLSEANVAAMETCATVVKNPGGVHHKPKMASKQHVRRQHMATLNQTRQLCGKLKRSLGTAAEPGVREVPSPSQQHPHSPRMHQGQGKGTHHKTQTNHAVVITPADPLLVLMTNLQPLQPPSAPGQLQRTTRMLQPITRYLAW